MARRPSLPPLRFALRPLAASLLAVALQAQARPIAFDLPAQPLAEAIKQVATQAGLTLVVDNALVAGKSAPAVEGRFEAEEALRRLLESSGLAVRLNGNQVIIAKAGATVLGEVSVVATPPLDGSADVGYRSEAISGIGPWAARKLQDTPYSTSVMSSDLLANLQASAPEQAFKYNPYTQVYIPANRLADNINMRGFYNNLRTQDGMPIYGANQSLEDKSAVEITTGLTGFMYGISNPAGVVNYVTKRAPAVPVATFTAGNFGGTGGFAHADVGAPLDAAGKLSYRLNAVLQDGQTFLDYQSVSKYLVSGALDWRLSDKLLLAFDASAYHKRTSGMQISFSPDTALQSSLDPSALDPSKLYGQKWGFQEDEYQQFGGRANWAIDDTFTLRSAARYSHTASERLNINATGITTLDQPYGERLYQISKIPYNNITSYAFLDASFATGTVVHKLTTGLAWDQSDSKASPDRTISLTIPGSFSFQDPVYVDKPSYTVGSKPRTDYTDNIYRRWVLGDDIRFSEQWSALAGANYVDVDWITHNLNTGAIASEYRKSKLTPTLSVMYKPQPWITTYASYIEALEQGGTAPGTALNAGEVLPPMVSKQYEIGTKAAVGEMLLTAALFDIQKANQYLDATTQYYVQNGREVHKGLEFTATGKLTSRLSLIGGMTWLDARIKTDGSDPTIEGKRPTTVPAKMAKLVAEYEFPFIPGLTLTGGIFYTGDVMNDDANTDRLPAFTTYDIGLRYQTLAAGRPLTLRFGISNLTDKHYWLPYGYLGDPRCLMASVELKL